MKVCLIDSAAYASNRIIPHWTPLGPAYLGAVLERGGHDVLIIERDALFRRNGLKLDKADRIMTDLLEDFRPDLAGISSPTELFHDARRSAEIVKRSFSDIPVVYGGHHATAVPEEVLEACDLIDVAAVGEGEETILEIADGLPFEDIRGIFYREGSCIKGNPERKSIERLDDLPFPARHLLDMKFHTRYSHCLIRNLTMKATTMLSSRGCPYKCRFCVESLAFGKRHRFHSSERIVREIDHILSSYDVEGLYFIDEGFLAKEQRVSELCELLIRNGFNRRVKWTAQVRTDALNRDILNLMKEAGCVQLECGFETASDRLLHTSDKGTSLEKNREGIRLIKSCGIRCVAYILTGLPGETEEEFNETVDFVKESGFNYVVFSKFSPHPGCAIYKELLEQGKIRKGFWVDDGSFYASRNFTDMSDERFGELFLRAYREVVEKVNTSDRMMNTSLFVRIKTLSLHELVYTLIHSPRLILKFFSNLIKVKVFGKGMKA